VSVPKQAKQKKMFTVAENKERKIFFSVKIKLPA
jgi:hypothetical protein